jgi:multidrug efflux system membrane fusion protein
MSSSPVTSASAASANTDFSTKPQKKRPWFWWLLLLVILGGVAWRLTHPGAAASAPKGSGHSGANAPVPVTLVPATTEDFPIYLDGLGTVQAYNSALVNARVSGLIQEIKFQEGQEVKQGDVLALIDPRTFQAQYDQTVAKRLQDAAHQKCAGSPDLRHAALFGGAA